jgi:hypothetical protein
MVAALFTLLLFLFLTLLGKAVLEALSFHFSILRGWLLAPSVGLAIVVLLTLNLNQTGLPVRTFAATLSLAFGAFIGVVFWWKRPAIPWKQLAPFLGAALFSLVYTCWPMFLYGFRWYGYMNGDMSLYCLGATRVMNHGFFQIPALPELNGTDYSQYMWFHAAAAMFRCGSDILLAWFASVTHETPLRISMPVVAAANMAQLWSAAALVLTRAASRRLALVTALLVAASPFYILGVMAQLLPQVGGLALLFCLCTLCMRPLAAANHWKTILPNAALVAAVAAVSCVYYPEVLPFGVLALLALHLWMLLRRNESIKSLTAILVPTLILLALFVRQGIFTAIGVILFSMSAGMKSGPIKATAFDTVLDPSLFASLPGMEPYYGGHRDPWISITIAVGIVFLLIAIWIAFRYAWKGEPAAFLLLVMLGLGVRLFASHSAFGVFKLAMYMQPVLLFAIAAAAVRILGKGCYLAPALYIPATMATAFLYVSGSTVSVLHSSVSLPGITDTDIRALALDPGEETVVSTPNEVGAALYGAEATGSEVKWADFNYFEGVSEMDYMPFRLLPFPSRIGLTKDYLTPAVLLRDKLIAEAAGHEVILGHEVISRQRVNDGQIPTYLGHLARDPWHSSNNAHLPRKGDSRYFSFDRMDTVSNYLAPLSSQEGGPFGPEAAKPSRWPPETDLYHRNGTFYGVGRYLLFEVIRPTSNVRVRISLTRTLTGAGRTTLPEDAEVRADGNQRLEFVGSGAANLISSPIHFYERNGRFYVALDLGTDGDYFPNHKTGLLRLFHTDLPVDNRQMVGFARDIALVTDAQYRSMERPKSITSWPADLLANPALEFSGIYEDGWISNRAFVILGAALAGERLHIAAQVPPLPRFVSSTGGVRVLLNGTPIYKAQVKPGSFEIDHALTADSPRNRVDFFFDQMAQLPGGDDRPVSAQLLQVTITPNPTGHK